MVTAPDRNVTIPVSSFEMSFGTELVTISENMQIQKICMLFENGNCEFHSIGIFVNMPDELIEGSARPLPYQQYIVYVSAIYPQFWPYVPIYCLILPFIKEDVGNTGGIFSPH